MYAGDFDSRSRVRMYVNVVRGSAWPAKSCRSMMSAPRSRAVVRAVTRSECTTTAASRLIRRAYFFTSFSTARVVSREAVKPSYPFPRGVATGRKSGPSRSSLMPATSIQRFSRRSSARDVRHSCGSRRRAVRPVPRHDTPSTPGPRAWLGHECLPEWTSLAPPTIGDTLSGTTRQSCHREAPPVPKRVFHEPDSHRHSHRPVSMRTGRPTCCSASISRAASMAPPMILALA
jgi:hypothetical protein